jgi:hypothetical protein
LDEELLEVERDDILNLEVDDAVQILRVTERQVEIQPEEIERRQDDRCGSEAGLEAFDYASECLHGVGNGFTELRHQAVSFDRFCRSDGSLFIFRSRKDSRDVFTHESGGIQKKREGNAPPLHDLELSALCPGEGHLAGLRAEIEA